MVQRVTFRRFVVGSLVAAVLIGGCMTSARAETHRFKPTVGYPTFAKREPVLHVKRGDIVETETLWGEWYERAGGKWPGEVGPFHVEGATPNDTLAVKILRLRPNRDVAVSTHNPQFGVLAADRWTPMLTDPIPAKRFIWKLDRGRMVGILDLPESRMKRIEVQLSPMLGRVAVAPQGEEAFDGLWPGYFGGNMDASDVREGTANLVPIEGTDLMQVQNSDNALFLSERDQNYYVLLSGRWFKSSTHVGSWELSGDGIAFKLKSWADKRNLLYAFAVDGDLVYVGKSTHPLRARMQAYQSPAKAPAKKEGKQ